MRIWEIELTSYCIHHCAAPRILRVGGSRKIDERTRFRSYAYTRGLYRHWQFSGMLAVEKQIATAWASSDRSVWALSNGWFESVYAEICTCTKRSFTRVLSRWHIPEYKP